MFWYTRLKITLSGSSNSNCRRLLRLQRLFNFLSRSGSRSETLKFSCTLRVDSGRHSRSPSWWSQQVATFHPSPDKEDIGEMFSRFCFIFEGIPWPPWDLRCPPHNCLARLTWCPHTRRSSGSTHFDQNSWTYVFFNVDFCLLPIHPHALAVWYDWQLNFSEDGRYLSILGQSAPARNCANLKIRNVKRKKAKESENSGRS